MGAGTQVREWSGVSRRRVPRFRMQAPLDVTVLRSGISDTLPGRAVDLCERGIAAILAGELVPGETVGVEVRLAPDAQPLRTRATVRYQDRLRFGLEFVTITPDQRSVVRDWAKVAGGVASENAEVANKNKAGIKAKTNGKPPALKNQDPPSSKGGKGKRNPKRMLLAAVGVLIVALLAAGFFWWKWNRDWQALESGASVQATPPAQVPTEVMQKLLVHKVDPVYPLEARRQNLQGIIALDIVVGKDGSVTALRALNGPDVLAQAAMNALRWWKFEPYRVNGQPTTAETTLAVEFKP
jgi:protein TonB